MPTPVLSGAFVLATVEWFKYLRSTIFIKIVALTDTVYTDLMIFLTALLVPAFTVMILFEGYKIITGQTTEPAATYVLKWLKITILASIATYSGLKNLELQYFISESQSAISVVLTKNTDLFANVDKRLTTTATLAGAITGFVNRTSGGDQVAKLVTVVAGNAGAVMPIITALATHTALQIFLKVGIMLAPIFVFFAFPYI